jgi:hypothetical protein
MNAGTVPFRTITSSTTDPSTITPSARRTTMNITANSQLIHEAMSRARMLKPQGTTSEASRPARRIAMRSRHEQSRALGNR